MDGLEVDYPKLRKFAKSVQSITIYIRSNTGRPDQLRQESVVAAGSWPSTCISRTGRAGLHQNPKVFTLDARDRAGRGSCGGAPCMAS